MKTVRDTYVISLQVKPHQQHTSVGVPACKRKTPCPYYLSSGVMTCRNVFYWASK